METKTVVTFIVVLILLVTGIAVGASYFGGTSGASPVDLTSFAQCLKASGAVFYGAFWCPHCQATKAIFGGAEQYLPYVECSTPDEQHQTQVCIDKGIKDYPTWIFANGTQISGQLTLESNPPQGFITLNQLSQGSNCPLPTDLAGAGTSTASTTPTGPGTSSVVRSIATSTGN